MKSRAHSFLLTVTAGALLTLTALPAHAQYMGSDSHEAKSAVTETAPTIGNSRPDANRKDATVIEGVNTAGTVRVNMLANLEALLNIGANGAQIIGILWGCALLFACIRKIRGVQLAKSLAIATLPIIAGLASPHVLNFVVVTCRDANLFS